MVPFIQRKVLIELEKHLSSPEISLILGPRQAGKTTVMKKIAEELKNKNQQAMFFNLDLIEDKQYFKSQHTLLDKIKKTIGQEGKTTIFIDEIQRLENSGIFLKGLYDMDTGYKIIVSGSGSLELKANIIEPMTGRKKIFYCYPLSFSEFASFQLNAKLEKIEERISSNEFERERLMNEYLNFGGYPRVVLASTYQEKISVLQEIFESYIEKDIKLLLKVEKEEAFEGLIRILADQVGNLINKHEIAVNLGISEKTVERYLYFLEKTFVISLVRPFFTNARKELKKSPKVYFLDTGFLRLARRLTAQKIIDVKGEVFENGCFLRLKEKYEQIKFWRTKSGAEVDFIINDIPVEVKMGIIKGDTIGKGLVSFILKYKPERVFIYAKNQETKFSKIGSEVRLIPYYKDLQI